MTALKWRLSSPSAQRTVCDGRWGPHIVWWWSPIKSVVSWNWLQMLIAADAGVSCCWVSNSFFHMKSVNDRVLFTLRKKRYDGFFLAGDQELDNNYYYVRLFTRLVRSNISQSLCWRHPFLSCASMPFDSFVFFLTKQVFTVLFLDGRLRSNCFVLGMLFSVLNWNGGIWHRLIFQLNCSRN